MSESGAGRATGVAFWSRAASAHPLPGFVDSALRGCGQVIYMNNPLTGLLNFLAMFWGAHAGGTTFAVAIGSVVGTCLSTAVAYPLRTGRGELRSGLYGFNGMLVGAGIPTFLGNTPLMWVVLVFASMVVTVVTLAVNRIFDIWKIPGFTFPFVLTTWLVLLAAYRLAGLSISGLPTAALLSQAGGDSAAIGVAGFVHASLVSVAQVYFVDDPISGAIFLLALLVESRWCAGLAALGALTAVACALMMGADGGAVAHGLWGYSAVLTAPAVGCVFMKTSPGTLVYCLAAAVFTVFVQGAIAALAGTVGLPALTFPFVLTSWLFLLAGRDFGPRASRADPDAA